MCACIYICTWKTYIYIYERERGFPGDTVVKNLPASAGDTRDTGLIPESGRSPGVGNGNLLQNSFISLSNLKCVEHQLGIRKCMGMCH